METVNEVLVGEMPKAVTVGTALSGSVIEVMALRLAETLPAASLAHA
jgi:hypothetical protein